MCVTTCVYIGLEIELTRAKNDVGARTRRLSRPEMYAYCLRVVNRASYSVRTERGGRNMKIWRQICFNDEKVPLTLCDCIF